MDTSSREWKEYWSKVFDCKIQPPEQVKKAIMRVYGAYPKDCMPQGLADPMYIMNCIALELGIGDGQGNFYIPEQTECQSYVQGGKVFNCKCGECF